MPKNTTKNKSNGASLGFEAELFATADKLRGHLDAAEYKNVVLGLIFLKYISDAFEKLHTQLQSQLSQGADPEDRDEYIAERVFWVPKEARWSYLRANAKQPTIGNLIDEAMLAIERDNPVLNNVLPGNYGRATLDKQRLGGLVDLISGIDFLDEEARKQDILGRVYEYFLSQFASLEGRKGGEFYTPHSVVRVLVEMLAPYKGRVFDPCCGSGGMFVQSEKFVEAHGGRIGDIAVYGQESNPNTWKLAKMNLAIRGIECDLGKEPSDSFTHDLHLDLKADFILANPPFNMSDWAGDTLREDKRWKYGVPPSGNANFAWVQHFIHHLSPVGMAGFVLANGSMSSNTSGEGEIRKAIIEADLVDCMVALPGQLFYSTQIPVCLWFLTRNKHGGGELRNRQGETLFIDARKLGTLVDRVHRDLRIEDISLIAVTYHTWRRDRGEISGLPFFITKESTYLDIPGFCKSATLGEIRQQGYILTPGRYVDTEEEEKQEESFVQKIKRVTLTLKDQFSEDERLKKKITQGLENITETMLKHWFVDYPESNGWKISSLAELFPKDKECVLTGPFGSNLHSYDYRTEGTPILLVKNIMYGKIIEKDLPLVGDHKLPDVLRYRLKTGDIVFTRVGAVGRSVYIHPRYEGWLISGQTLRVRIADRNILNPRYLAQVYLEPSFISMVESYALGTTRPSLNTSILLSFKFVVPPIEIQDKFAEIALSFDDKILNNDAENRTLTDLRDTMLPRMIRG